MNTKRIPTRECKEADHAAETQWLHTASKDSAPRCDPKRQADEALWEPHAVQRACGHWETLIVGRPWAYVDRVAARVPCRACRRQNGNGTEDMSWLSGAR